MKKNTIIFRFLMPLVVAAAMGVPSHAARHLAAPSVPSPVVPAAANCTAVGQSMAARDGGTLQLATAQSRGGRTVCVIVYTVPGRNGQPPRRVEKEVPAD